MRRLHPFFLGPQLSAVLMLGFVLSAFASAQQSEPGQAPPTTSVTVTPSAAQQAAASSPIPGTNSSSVLFVLDTSDKAKGSRDTLKRAAESAAKQFGSDNELGLMTAGDKPNLAQDFTSDPNLVSGAIKKSRFGGPLALYETLSAAVQYVRGNSTNDRNAIIAFVADLERANKMATGWEESLHGNPPVPIYLVSIRGSSPETLELAQRIAVGSGGIAYVPTKSSDMSKLAKMIAGRLGASPAGDAHAKADEPARPLDNYTALIVRGIPVESGKETTEISGGENVILQRILVSRLQRSKLFPEVRDGGTVDDSSPARPSADAQPGNELEMLPMIVEFRRGNRVQRQTMPFFGGASKLRVQVILRDRTTKEMLATFVEQGDHASGFFGGSDESVQAQAMLEVSNKIVDHLKRMKERKR